MSLSCVFGCQDQEDNVRHYVVCPVLLEFALTALRLDPADLLRGRPSVLSTLGLQPANPACIYLFTLYTFCFRCTTAGRTVTPLIILI